MEVEIFSDALLEAVPLLDGEGVGLSDDRYDVHVAMEMLHELYIDRT